MALAASLFAPYKRLHRQVAALSQAMPEEKYSFRPSSEVRTFGEQLRHIGAVQWVVGCGLLRESVPVDVGDGDTGPLYLIDKAGIIAYTDQSFECIARAIAATTELNLLEFVPHPYDPQNLDFDRLGLITGYASHGWEHYGQMVVYARLNGITPPLLKA